MELQNEEKFIRNVESLIDPPAVSNLLSIQRLKAILPPAVLKRLLHKAAKKTPRIGFVIEPYSLFLFFKLKDLERAKSMLPDRYELAETRIFADEEPGHYMGIGNLSTRASTFWGARQECYLIARDKESGLLSWIFIDIMSNTVIALPKRGIGNPNSRNAVFTTTSKGEVILDFEEDRTGRRLALNGSIKNGTLRELDEPIWVMGNTSIGHDKRFATRDEKPFAVVFDPAEVHSALDIPVEDIAIRENTLFPGLAEPELAKVLCFPYAQHYMADSPGRRTVVKDREDMIRKYNELALATGMKTFSEKTILLQLFFAVTAGGVIGTILGLLLLRSAG